MAIKNVWSLNIDEALAADWMKRMLGKNYEVFYPLNAQLKNVDLAVYSLRKAKSKTVQVKGSRTYEPRKSEINKYGTGSAAWITITKDSIFKPQNRLDYFIFVLHSFASGKIKKEIQLDYLVIPTKALQAIARKKKLRRGKKYHFFIWIDSVGKRSFDFNNPNGQTIHLSQFLNNWKLLEK